jgi:hypothetical protein
VNSQQIKEKLHFDLSMTHWLKEIAYQLALLNEAKQEPQLETRPMPRKKAVQ